MDKLMNTNFFQSAVLHIFYTFCVLPQLYSFVGNTMQQASKEIN